MDKGKAEDTARRAFVTINALPWAEVRLDGRALGNTPRRRVALKPGKHIFSLHCPPLGKTVPVPVNLSAGKTLNILVDLNADPPKITRR